MNDSMRNELRFCIERHVGGFNPKSSDTGERMDRYASDLMYAAVHWEEYFGVTRYTEATDDIARHLSSAAGKLRKLDQSFFYHADAQWKRHTRSAGRGGEFTGFTAQLDDALKFLSGYRKTLRAQKDAGVKRNWVAASVARECKYVWGQECLINPDRRRDFDNVVSDKAINMTCDEAIYELHVSELLSLSASVQHHTRPGPIGRFIEDIFAILSITDQGGQAVTAATALASLRTLKHQ